MAKRGQNEGTIVKRADGRWVAALNLGYVDGKRKRKWFYGKTRKEVQEALTKALRDTQRGLPIASTRQTVGQFLMLAQRRPSSILNGGNVSHDAGRNGRVQP